MLHEPGATGPSWLPRTPDRKDRGADASRRRRNAAQRSGRGVPTAKAHVSHILSELGLDNRVQIALLVYRRGPR